MQGRGLRRLRSCATTAGTGLSSHKTESRRYGAEFAAGYPDGVGAFLRAGERRFDFSFVSFVSFVSFPFSFSVSFPFFLTGAA